MASRTFNVSDGTLLLVFWKKNTTSERLSIPTQVPCFSSCFNTPQSISWSTLPKSGLHWSQKAATQPLCSKSKKPAQVSVFRKFKIISCYCSLTSQKSKQSQEFKMPCHMSTMVPECTQTVCLRKDIFLAKYPESLYIV